MSIASQSAMPQVVRRPRRPAIVAVPTRRPGVTVGKIGALVVATALAAALGTAALMLALITLIAGASS
jgi:hypothetical protein